MTSTMDRRTFVRTATAAAAAATVAPRSLHGDAPVVMTPQSIKPVVISDLSGIKYKNGGPVSGVEKAYDMITQGADVLDAVVAGVNIPELDPEEAGVGYGGLPNAEGVVQLDACCMHGPKKWAGGVAALEGVRTPSLVAKAVMEYTDHHLLVGKGAQDFARSMGFTVESDLNTERSRKLWLEWKRRVDPSHYLDPEKRVRRGYEVGLEMVREGLIEESHFWGTVSCNGISPNGEICGVTTTSGLSWKIPGRTGDSPILGAGLYVDGDVGAAGSTGRGEANLFNLSCFLIVEQLRRGMHPKDAGMKALERIKANTVEQRLLNSRGLPAFNVRFFALNAKGEYAGVAMYAAGETEYAVCTENGAETLPLEGLVSGAPTD
ncbi:MAG: asparaginase [Gemmatimonadales bacterium]|nr:asparaginase [Gemmatimonadales bacterium]NIN49118.1 asparaginase [Gemmatimonadales bacterium]NIP06582.1 asparaginase [Gemmatimonadales bacterium]NIR00279.1 asparaginase [Gemmatimonadales bacterium]NIS64612.1 asparaginase [Gemmatimonadales bacterium]